MSENTCHKHRAEDPPSLFQNGNPVFQAHHVGWIVCTSFTVVATVASLWLINKHLQWYTNKREQRYIVRLLFLVPIYAIISLASYLFWNHSTPLILLRDMYEAIVLTAFFYLLLVYLSPDPEEQKRIFLKAGLSRANDAAARQKGEKVRKWMFPLGFVKWKPQDGLYFLQLMKWGVLQYCVIRPLTTLIAVILDYAGLYCESSWSPVWGHVWIVVIISISVTIAMYCLLQLYMPVAKELAPHRPILKLFSVKAVVFLTFWQATLLSLLSMLGVVKDTRYMTAEDINIGIGALLETFEMMIFAFVHIKAFTYKPYKLVYQPELKGPPPKRTPRLRSLGHALDFRETFREIWVGCIYLIDKIRGKEPTPDFGARRAAHYEEAFGRPRPLRAAGDPQGRPTREAGGKIRKPRPNPSTDITINQQVEVDVGGERQWLGIGDDYGYGLGYFRRERSEGLSIQIEKELQMRGYSSGESVQPVQDAGANVHAKEASNTEPPSRGRRSWWRNIYDRISQSGHEEGGDGYTPSLPRRLQSRSRSRRHHEGQAELLEDDRGIPEIPPNSFPLSQPSAVAAHHSLHSQIPTRSSGNSDAGDVLAPLGIYRERRRSYRPKRHARGESSTALLSSPVQTSPDPDVPPRTAYPMAKVVTPSRSGNTPETEQPGELVPAPPHSDYYNRSDSLLNRIFQHSEAGSLTDQTRETDSAYSLPSVSMDGHLSPRRHPVASTSQFHMPTPDEFGGVVGDRRLRVQENMIHPARSIRSMNASHNPSMGDIASHSESDLVDPPPVPAKDLDYLPVPNRRSHRRESAHYRPSLRGMDSASLPSLPEDTQFIVESPTPPSTRTGGTLAGGDTTTDADVGSFVSSDDFYSEHRLSAGVLPHQLISEPPLSHRKTNRRLLVDQTSASSRPLSNQSFSPSINTQYSQAYQSPPSTSAPLAGAPRHKANRSSFKRVQLHPAQSLNSASEQGQSSLLQAPGRFSKSRQSVDSADFSDLSFYTAVSQPSAPDSRGQRS